MCLEEAQQAAVSAKLPVMQSDVDTVTIARPSVKKNAYAVVVGIEGYRENLPKADFAAHDAKLMGEYLIKVLGYPEENVVVRLNEKATRTDLEKYVESWLVNHVEKDSSVFIYFSGHGAPDPKTSNAYLVPYDGDPAFIDKTGYPLKRLYEYLGKLPAKEVVVVLDSCFSGTGGRSVIAEGTRPMLLSIENPVLTGGRTVVLAASSGSQVSSAYKEKGHGLLTYFVLKGLRGEADQNKDGNIDLSELFEYAKPQIERTARREFNNEQTPQLLGNPEMLRRGIRLVERAVP
nr:caspase family protein [Nitrospirota bacterium]